MVPIAPPKTKSPRLALCSRSASRGGVDGAWWPGSSDLGAELPDLLAVVSSMIGEVRRVVYDPCMWPPTPSRVIRRGVAVAVDPYSLVNSDTLYLIGTHSRDAVLYVIPPSCDATLANRVLGAVSDSTVPMLASVVKHLLGQLAEVRKGS
jgi:Family of unknown function (DUF5994)